MARFDRANAPLPLKGKTLFNNKTLMITGGTGSFGQKVLKRFLDTDVKEIRIFSRDEKKQEDMRIALNHPKLRFYIGDVRDEASLRQAMKGVNYVFHAAALKQVTKASSLTINLDGTDEYEPAHARFSRLAG